MSKEHKELKGNMYGMSTLVRELIKPTDVRNYSFGDEIANELLQDSLLALNKDNAYNMFPDFKGNIGAWAQNGEFLMFKLQEIEDANS